MFLLDLCMKCIEMCLWLNSSRKRIFSFRLFTNKLHLFQHITEIILSCLKLIFQALLVTTTAEGSKGVHSELNQRTEELWEINGGNFFSCIQIVNDKSCFMKQLLKVKVEINNFTLYWSLIVSATGFAEGEEWKWWIKGVKSFQAEQDLPCISTQSNFEFGNITTPRSIPNSKNV